MSDYRSRRGIAVSVMTVTPMPWRWSKLNDWFCAGYVGMVGSRRKIRALLDQLGTDVPAAAKAALHGPAGLDIGAIDPEEIALSIIGEIVMQRRRAMQKGGAETADVEPDTEAV